MSILSGMALMHMGGQKPLCPDFRFWVSPTPLPLIPASTSQAARETSGIHHEIPTPDPRLLPGITGKYLSLMASATGPPLFHYHSWADTPSSQAVTFPAA